MTDPLISRGNMFTSKGSQNHMVSNMWKDTIRTEQRAARKGPSTWLRQEGLNLRELRSALYKPSSSVYGASCAASKHNIVLETERKVEIPSAGHKPILDTTFFRKTGVNLNF
jgi:hypothetical protein